MKERGINVGDRNGMKREENRRKASESAKRKFLKRPELREMMSKNARAAWARGVYDGASVGKCKWYDFTKKDGAIVKCQGTWEVTYAKWLDENDILFRAHEGRIRYVDEEGKERSYYPDFFLVEEGRYVDVKNPYHERLGGRKMEFVRASNPSLRIDVLGPKELRSLGLSLVGFSGKKGSGD